MLLSSQPHQTGAEAPSNPYHMTPKIIRRLCDNETVNTSRQRSEKSLLSLPPEILEMVYHHLDTVDDVHSLGRTHSKFYLLIDRRAVYTEIMRSIIGRSWIHRYDLQLCNVLALHRDVVKHFQHEGEPFPLSLASDGPRYNEWESKLECATSKQRCTYGPCVACIPDDVVYDILARYQGMRVLEDLWLERHLEEDDLLTADVSFDEQGFVRQYACLLDRAQNHVQDDLAARSTRNLAIHSYTKFNPDQRGRLYSAITFVWILNELRWVLTNFVYPSRSSRHVEILKRCMADLTDQTHNHVLDLLDHHAVFTFLYHHLLPLHSSVLQNQDSSRFPLSFHTDLLAGAQSARSLQFFLLAGQTYFQPPDLIDLAVRDKLARVPPYPKAMLPASTEQWVRPSKAFAFPGNVPLSEYESRLTGLFNTHVSLINRSSFAQTQGHMIRRGPQQSLPDFNGIADLASRYFVDSAVAALEAGQCWKEEGRPVRDIFAGEWQRRAMWSVWWWANSEDKARAIIARWME